MLGGDQGLIQMSMREIFDSQESITVQVQYLEIYNEVIHDLLNAKSTKSLKLNGENVVGAKKVQI